MTQHRATGRGMQHRCRHGKPSVWRPFLRATTAVALSCGGVVALLAVLLADTFRLPIGGVAAVELVTLAGVLIGTGWVLALPPGEAWGRVTGNA